MIFVIYDALSSKTILEAVLELIVPARCPGGRFAHPDLYFLYINHRHSADSAQSNVPMGAKMCKVNQFTVHQDEYEEGVRCCLL